MIWSVLLTGDLVEELKYERRLDPVRLFTVRENRRDTQTGGEEKVRTPQVGKGRLFAKFGMCYIVGKPKYSNNFSLTHVARFSLEIDMNNKN